NNPRTVPNRSRNGIQNLFNRGNYRQSFTPPIHSQSERSDEPQPAHHRYQRHMNPSRTAVGTLAIGDAAWCHWKLVFQCESGCNDTRRQPQPSDIRTHHSGHGYECPRLLEVFPQFKPTTLFTFPFAPTPSLCSLWLNNCRPRATPPVEVE